MVAKQRFTDRSEVYEAHRYIGVNDEQGQQQAAKQLADFILDTDARGEVGQRERSQVIRKDNAIWPNIWVLVNFEQDIWSEMRPGDWILRRPGEPRELWTKTHTFIKRTYRPVIGDYGLLEESDFSGVQLIHGVDGENKLMVDGVDLTEYAQAITIEADGFSSTVTLTLNAPLPTKAHVHGGQIRHEDIGRLLNKLSTHDLEAELDRRTSLASIPKR